MAQFENNRIYAVAGHTLNALIVTMHEMAPVCDDMMESFAEKVRSSTLDQHLCGALKEKLNPGDPS